MNEIRRIIREEAESVVDEMAYAGDLGIRYSPDQESESFFSSEVTLEPNRKGAEKFARSGRFKTLAKKYFENIPFNIWVAPLIGVGADVYDSIDSTRVRRIQLVPDGIAKLEKLGFEAPSRVGSDDTVILYTAMSTGQDTIATPWMLIHAMFDSGSPEFEKLAPSWSDTWRKFSESFIPWMTMKSARTKSIQTDRDVAAEALVQELIDRRGFHLSPQNKRGKPPPRALVSLVDDIKKVADEFRRNAPGHFIAVVLN